MPETPASSAVLRDPSGIRATPAPTADASSEGAARPARPPLLTVAAALDRLLAGVEAPTDHETVALADARGRVLAAALVSRLDVPAGDNAQMDGYALRVADLGDLAEAGDTSPIALPVSQRIPAGHPATPLQPGSVARIFTGAWLPGGADAVVMQEDTVFDATTGRVTFDARPERGAWIRRRGEDIRDGQTILSAGTRLEAQHLGLAASIGTAKVEVFRRPRVALFSTGDELAMPGEVAVEDLKPGALFNSNRFTLRAMIESLGCTVVDLGIVPDTLAATRAALVRAARSNDGANDGTNDRPNDGANDGAAADVIVTSGGVSVGEEDHIKPAVAAEGSIDSWQIAIKPGKPLAFGRVRAHGRTALFVGLPGNPVSSFVTFLVFARPLLMRLQGIVDVAPPTYALRADFDWTRPDRRQEFLRARVNAAGGLELHAQQGSGVMTSTVWADGLIDNPAGKTIASGDTVRYLPFAGLLR